MPPSGSAITSLWTRKRAPRRAANAARRSGVSASQSPRKNGVARMMSQRRTRTVSAMVGVATSSADRRSTGPAPSAREQTELRKRQRNLRRRRQTGERTFERTERAPLARGWTTEQDQDARVVREKIARHLAERAQAIGRSCVVHGEDQRPPAELVEVELLLGEHHRRASRRHARSYHESPSGAKVGRHVAFDQRPP